MIEIIRHRQEWKPVDRKQQAPVLDGINNAVRLVDEETGKPVAIQLLLGDIFHNERRWLARQFNFATKWNDPQTSKALTGASRLNGMRYENRTFGTTAPSPLRQRYGCSYSQFNTAYPEAYAILEQMTRMWWLMFQENMPEAFNLHRSLVDEQINPDWLIGGYGWTSGIINNTAALPYHRDSNNIKGTVSAMLAIRSRVGGGALHLPEYDVTLGIPDGSLTIFDGQDVWHGVTPLVNERPDAYRYTIVWYTKSGVKECGCAEDEPRRAASRATQLADARLANDD